MMAQKNLHKIKSTGYKIPSSYFDSVEDDIFSKLKEETIKTKVNQHGFSVPNDYFESFEITKTEKESIKVIPMFNWKKAAIVSTIAASMVLALNVIFQSSDVVTMNDVDTASIEYYLMEEDLTAYDIAPYLNSNQINSDNFIENIIDASDIEDYLLQNSDVENLITD